MAVAADTYTEKTDEQKAITEMVRQFADNEIIPVAEEYDHEDKFPEPIVEQMKELGLFGVTIPEEYGGMGLDLTTYAMIVEELSRGWISISGVVNTHFIGSYLLMKFGTEEQKDHFLPKMATGEIRAAFSLSEPEVGSDVQGIKSTAKRADDGNWELNGQKMWVTNGLLSGVVFVLVKSDPKADPPYKGMTCFICEKEPGADEVPGLTIPPKIKKMGYKGVESTELVFDGFKVSEDRVLGGPDGLGQGFVQMMDALEVGRVNVAARGVGVAQRALELALRYSQERKTFGQADRPASGDHLQARRDGDPAGGRATADDEGGPAEGRRRAIRPGGRDGEAVRVRGRQGERRGVPANSRRVRILEGVRDRADLPRRAVAPDRRGHLRDPEDGDREEAPGAKQDLMSAAWRARRADRGRRTGTSSVEVPALGPLKLVVRLELRGRGDVQVFRVRLPGPEVTKGEPEDARVQVAMSRPSSTSSPRRASCGTGATPTSTARSRSRATPRSAS